MRKLLLILLAIPALVVGLLAGTASATSLSGLGAPPVNNTNCWARDGFGFVEVNCQWGTPYNYARQLYAPWINSGQIILYGSNWPTAAGQPNGTSAWHEDWGSYFQTVITNSPAAFNFTVAYYQSYVDANIITVCENFGSFGCV